MTTQQLRSIPALHMRGISAETQALFRIVAGKGYGKAQDKDGFRYPTFDEEGKRRLRWKHVDSHAAAGDKYGWEIMPDGTAQTWKIYVADYKALREAVERKNGVLYWCAGEVDVWTLHAASASGSYPPAASAFGEKNIPENIAEWLKSIGVNRVVYYPDLDKPGLAAAAKLYRLLSGSGMALELYRLPGDIGSKLDLNALWQQVKFNKDAFWKALKTCPAIDDIEMYDDSLDHVQAPQQNSNGEMPPEYYKAIEERLGIKRYRANGFSFNILCPFHEETKPSAAWHRDNHFLHCQVCGTYNAKQTAERKGIDYRQYLPAREVRSGALDVRPASPYTPPAQPAQQPPAFNFNDFVMTGGQASQLYVRDIDPQAKSDPDFVPVVIPFKPLHRFGGFAEIMTTGKMVGIAAATGGNKTIFLETIVEAYLNIGESVLIWSPEWSGRELMQRRGTRFGGVSMERILKAQAYKYYQERGLAVPFDSIRPLTPDELEACNEANVASDAWLAEPFYIKQRRLGLDALLYGIEGATREIRALGRTLRVLVIDYAQMLRLNARDPQKRTLQDAIAELKDLAGDIGVLPWVASQVTKESGRNVNATGTLLDESSAQFLRFDEFNLALTLQMNYFPIDDIKYPLAGQHDGTATISVVKNNIGRRGTVTVLTDLDRLQWLDEETPAREYHPKPPGYKRKRRAS